MSDSALDIPVTLPRDDPTISYWQDHPDQIADHRTTAALPTHADVVVIGSGISGASIAWHLLQDRSLDGKQPSVVMLEARQACSGATGRNGGHTKAASYRSFVKNTDRLGSAELAAQIARLELANIKATHAFADAHQIACDAKLCDTVDAIYEKALWEQAQTSIAAMRDELGADDDAARYVIHTREEMQQAFYCEGEGEEDKGERLWGGIQYLAGSISAYKFTIGVLKLALAKGLNLQCRTPAEQLCRATDGSGWEVKTPRGTIKARKVVLATNGYTARIWDAFQGVVVPMRGQVQAQRLGQNMPKHLASGGGLTTTYSFIYKGGYEYMIPHQPSNGPERIVIGGGVAKGTGDAKVEYGTTDDTVTNPNISRHLSRSTPSYFGNRWGQDDEDGLVAKEWSGIMGYGDGYPLVGQVPGEEGLWASCSFHGHGMVLCWLCGKALVEMMRKEDGEENLDEANAGAMEEWFPAAFLLTEARMTRRAVIEYGK